MPYAFQVVGVVSLAAIALGIVLALGSEALSTARSAWRGYLKGIIESSGYEIERALGDTAINARNDHWKVVRLVDHIESLEKRLRALEEQTR